MTRRAAWPALQRQGWSPIPHRDDRAGVGHCDQAGPTPNYRRDETPAGLAGALAAGMSSSSTEIMIEYEVSPSSVSLWTVPTISSFTDNSTERPLRIGGTTLIRSDLKSLRR